MEMEPEKIAKFMTNEFTGLLRKHGYNWETNPVSSGEFSELLFYVNCGLIGKHEMKAFISEMIAEKKTVTQIYVERNASFFNGLLDRYVQNVQKTKETTLTPATD